jgi:hypothetical protein
MLIAKRIARMSPFIRRALVVFLGLCFALGVSTTVIASSAMAIEMAQMAQMSADVQAADCQGDNGLPRSEQPSGCSIACASVGFDLPSAIATIEPAAPVREKLLLTSTVADGASPPPITPPPRFFV